MPGHMKRRRTKDCADITWRGQHYLVPVKVLDQYKTVVESDGESDSIESVFGELIHEYGEPAVLLKGLRTREGLSQVEFAEILGITQQNLSAMENGRRAIGKEMAKRIAEEFDVDYRYFL